SVPTTGGYTGIALAYHHFDVAGLDVVPVTPERWGDLETLFGRRGAIAGCWCMWFRHTASEWDWAGGDTRRAEMAGLVAGDARPGLLGYVDGVPVGWVAVAPRSEYGRLMSPRARTYRSFDDTPTWVITCFFIAKGHRRSGVAGALLDAAVDHAAAQGATVIEGYPVDNEGPRQDDHVFTGTLGMFTRAGFVEVQRLHGRPLVRREVAAG
ncbi:MAG TPA: GNAT family N-acetyltransferase, partial [Acidimicrobiia bacterium]